MQLISPQTQADGTGASLLSSCLAFGPSHSFEREMEQQKVLGFWERRECQTSELVQSFLKLWRWLTGMETADGVG